MKGTEFLEVQGAGYTGTIPELRLLPSGTSIVNLRICVNRRWQADDGQWQSSETWVNAVFQDELATEAMTIEKGSLIYFTGSMSQRQLNSGKTYEIKVRRWHPVGDGPRRQEHDPLVV